MENRKLVLGDDIRAALKEAGVFPAKTRNQNPGRNFYCRI